MRRFIVGLGNPGEEYSNTRHNLGFRVIDDLSSRLKVRLRAGRGNYLIGRRTADSGQQIADLYLVKPLTFVNLSGIAVLDLVERYEIDLESLLIPCDDVNLPLGKLRLREKGSDGGHKGLASIIYYLRTEDFPRLRMGVGMPEGEEMAEWVLSQFDPGERDLVDETVKRAADACLLWCDDGTEKAMSVYNQDP